MTRRARALAMALAAGLVVLSGARPQAYLKLGYRVGDRSLPLAWKQFPVRYFVTDRGVPGVDADQFRDAVARAFDTWRQVPGAGASFTFVGFTSAEPFEDDGMNVLGFEDRPELERVLGATTYLIDRVTGDILESDIFFNSAFDWSVAPAGETGKEDVQSIATHEIGHLLGLGHSALGETELRPDGGRRVIAAESVMFPIAYSAGSIESRTLKPDDVAGVSDIYGAGGFRAETGSVRGRVTKDGRGVFGAHVVAFDLQRGTLVGNFSLDADGNFVIAGLEPGPHVLRVEPLDDSDLESYFDDPSRVDLDFGVTFLDRLAVVPRGGSTPALTIAVRAK
jgi:hypothetical protein